MKKLILLTLFVLKPLSFALDLNRANQGVCNTGESVCVYFAPTDMPVEAVRAYMKAAKKSIKIASYNFSIEDYADVLNDKAKKMSLLST